MRDQLADDARHAYRRQRHMWPYSGPKPTKTRRLIAAEHALPRRWFERKIRGLDIVVLDYLLHSIPSDIAQDRSMRTLAQVCQHVLKAAGYKSLGKFREIPGRFPQGAAIWAKKLIERGGDLPPITIVRVVPYLSPSLRNSEPGIRWLRDNVLRLPTLISAPDLAALIPDGVGGTFGQRVRSARRFLQSRGAVCLGEHQTDQGRKVLWATRDIARLQQMTPRERMREVFGRQPYRRRRQCPHR
jgi:hypothetical protein